MQPRFSLSRVSLPASVLAASLLLSLSLLGQSPKAALAAGPAELPAGGAGYSLFLPLLTTQNTDAGPAWPTLDTFAASVADASGGTLRGVYAPGTLALGIDQQPANDYGYVTRSPERVTQYQLASLYGAIGLLAHNGLAGQYFDDLSLGQSLWLVHGDGSRQKYVVAQVYRFQALAPNDPYTDMVNLATGERLSTLDVFKLVYTGERVTFQTCIARDGDPSWGRLFVVALPAE